MMASRSPESQKRILEGTERLQEEYLMTRIRRDLGMSQAELAASLGVSQPVISKIEKVRQNIGLFTMKRYIEALGGGNCRFKSKCLREGLVCIRFSVCEVVERKPIVFNKRRCVSKHFISDRTLFSSA